MKAALDLLLGEDEGRNGDKKPRPDGQVGQIGAADGRQRKAVGQAEEEGHRPGDGNEQRRPSPDLQGIFREQAELGLEVEEGPAMRGQEVDIGGRWGTGLSVLLLPARLGLAAVRHPALAFSRWRPSRCRQG